MDGSLSIEHADIASRIGGVVDPQQMGAIEDTAGDDEDNESIEHSQDEAADIGKLPALIFMIKV